MSGHSKWHNIRLQKGKMDLQRGKIFGKLSREIIIAARSGGGNPEANSRLRLAIEKARENSMPAENIKRAVQKGTGELSSESYEEVTYEGYGLGGTAVLVEAATDNRNRTVADLRHLFAKYGGNLGENGSVAWQFSRQGVITVPAENSHGDGYDEDTLMEAALEAGAEDFMREGDSYEITTPVEGLAAVREVLMERGIPITSSEIEMLPQSTVQLEGEAARRMLKLMEALEDHEDVQRVASNFDIADNILQEQSA